LIKEGVLRRGTASALPHAYPGNGEIAENHLAVSNSQFLALGLSPTILSDDLLNEVTGIAKRYRNCAGRDQGTSSCPAA